VEVHTHGSRGARCARGGRLVRLLTVAAMAATGLASMRVASGVAHASPAPVASSGYSITTETGQVVTFGGVGWRGSVTAPLNRPVVGEAATPDSGGYWLAASDGGVFTFGDAGFFGSAGAIPLFQPVVGMAPTPDGRGYWLVAADGGVFSYGDAAFYGSTGNIRLAQPIVGMAATPDGHGYWLVARDGGVFSFGDAVFHGSMGAVRLNQPVVGMAAAPDGAGYWLVAADGGIFNFGDAAFYGSTGNEALARPIVGMARTPDGAGYWLVAADGGMFTFGDAPFRGSGFGDVPWGESVVGMAAGAGAGTGVGAAQGVPPVTATPGGYANPMRGVAGLTSMRIDEGVDYGGSGPVFAIGDGVVLNTTSPNWPPYPGAFISYRLTDGPATGAVVYVAENVTPQVSVGQRVNANTVLGTLHNAYPYMEIGWGIFSGAPQALGNPGYDGSDPTQAGVNFSDLLATLGAPPGVNNGRVTGGTLPVWWAQW
jgi:hypothetical protein